jgi:hypothetical protein
MSSFDKELIECRVIRVEDSVQKGNEGRHRGSFKIIKPKFSQ